MGNATLRHLIDALRQQYRITIDWKGEHYLGLTLKWNYAQGYVDISMPDYVKHALHEFQHPAPKRPEHSPSKWTAPIYGAKIQYAPPLDDGQILSPKEITQVQKVVGKLLYYALAVDNTILVILGDLASAQTKSTQTTVKAITHLLNYMATHPEATIRFHKSEMMLHIHSDASYLSVANAKSRAGGYYFLSSQAINPAASPQNGPIYVLSKILKRVLASASEAEIGATFTNAQEAIPIRHMLMEMGHPQHATPIQVDNTTAVGFANKKIKQKRSKSIHMNYYWLQDRSDQKQFHIYWAPGAGNLADYPTKLFSPAHHKRVRGIYLHQPSHNLPYNSARV